MGGIYIYIFDWVSLIIKYKLYLNVYTENKYIWRIYLFLLEPKKKKPKKENIMIHKRIKENER